MTSMNIREDEIRKIVCKVLEDNLSPIKNKKEIPVEVSARHVHLCQSDLDKLFGTGYKLTFKKELSQPGQYLCEERVKLITEKSEMINVAILGPVRSKTQVEISTSDARILGIRPPVCISGNLDFAEDIFIMHGKNIVEAKNSVIIAQNHIHMTPEDSDEFNVADGQCVQVKINTDRPITFNNVPVRVNKNSKLAMHIDFDEANACNLLSYSFGQIL